MIALNDKDITYVYTLKPLNESEGQFVVATAPKGDQCQIGDPYDKQVEMEQAFKGKT